MSDAAPLVLRTPRLDLVAATLAHVDAELASPAALAALLGAAVPADWPPGEYDRGAQVFLRGRLVAEGPSGEGWFTWYAMTRHADGSRDALIAAAGFYGPPGEGVVEIGYSVVPAAQGRGYATEIVQALVAQAFTRPEVEAVIAHTVDENLASTRTLLRAGFRREGPGAEPGTVAYRVARPVDVIRAETPTDVAAIRALTEAAFRDAPHTSHTEQHIVDALRDAGALAVSLVAERGGALLGHVALSPVAISDGSAGWYGLGPISVDPGHQRRGIGARLMNAALDALRARGAAGCVLLGDPAYYARFGFAPAPGLVLPGVPAGNFQALAFGPAVPRGTVAYHPAFDASAPRTDAGDPPADPGSHGGRKTSPE